MWEKECFLKTWLLICSYILGESKGKYPFDLYRFDKNLSEYCIIDLPFAGTCCTDIEITSTISRDESRFKGHISYDNDIDLSGIYTYSAGHGHNGKNPAITSPRL